MAKQKDQTGELSPRESEMLDLIVDLETRLKAVEGQQPVYGSGPPTKVDELQAQFDAEHAALVEEFKDFQGIQAVARRSEFGVEVAGDIRLLDEPPVEEDPAGQHRKWRLRRFNFAKEGRAQEAAARGWVKVRMSEIRNIESLPTAVAGEEYVRTGDRGQEWLHKMPEKWYAYLKRREAAISDGLLHSEAKLRDHLAASVSSLAGKSGENADQAGSFIANKGFQLSVTPGETERFTA